MAKKIKELHEFYLSCTISESVLSTPILYKKSKNGNTRIWTGHVILADLPPTENWFLLAEKKPIDFKSKDAAIYYTSFQQENGKLTTSAPTVITVGKNVGRKDETTPFQQALLAVRTEFNKKSRSGAVINSDELQKEITFENIVESGHRVNVMALHDVEKANNWTKVIYPACVQPKLDGIHIVAVYVHDDIDIYSRGMSKKISQNHIKTALLPVLKKYPGLYLTGEIYKHGMDRQKIVSQATQEKDENINVRLEMHVFDLFQIPLEGQKFVELKFYERYNLAKKIVDKVKSDCVKLVVTKKVNNREEIMNFYEECMEKKYEGIIIRNAYSFYEYGITSTIRSYNAMKLKFREDDEFIIINFKEGEGKFKGCIIFEAKCKAAECTFWVAPKWALIDRKKAFLEGASYINKIATISYDSISEEGIPQQPILISFK